MNDHNLSPPAEHADWFKLVSVDLENTGIAGIPGDEMGVVTAYEYSPNAEPVSVADIKRAQDAIAASGSWRRDQRTKEKWVGVPIATAFPKRNLTKPHDKQWVENHIVMWLANGLLVIDRRADPTLRRHDPVEFVIVGRPPTHGDVEGF